MPDNPFDRRKPWFRAKRYGLGAGLPIAWQGWALVVSYSAAIVGLALLAEEADAAALGVILALMLVATAAMVLVARARTEGGWRWRWGGDD